MRAARKLGTVVLALAVVLAAVYATGAFTSTSAERSADVTVAGDASAFLAFETSEGPNGQFASYGSDGALQVRMGEGSRGVNPGSRTAFQNVFTTLNKGAQPVSVWFDGGSKAVTFVGPDGNPIESESRAVTLRPGGQSLHVGLVIDSRGVEPGKNLLQSVEVRTATGEKSQANSIENVNSDTGNGGVRSDNGSNDRIENAGNGWSGDEETVTSNNDRSDTSENGNSGDARTDSNNDGSSGEQPHTVEIAGHTFEIPEFLADLSLEDAKTAIKGAFFGQTGMRDGMHPVDSANSVFYILGQIAGSFVPTLGSVADARDAVQDAANGKLGTAALSAAGAIPGLAKLTEGQLAIRHLKDWKKSFGGEMAGDLKTLGQLIVNHVGPYMPNSIVKKALDVTTDGAASTLKKDGFTVEQITEFSKDGNLEMMAEASESGLKLSPESTNFKRVSRLRNMDVPAEDVVWYVENGYSLKWVENLRKSGRSPEFIKDVYKWGSRGQESTDWYSMANDYCSVQASLEDRKEENKQACNNLPTQ